jgi:hypothetical protein
MHSRCGLKHFADKSSNAANNRRIHLLNRKQHRVRQLDDLP